MNEKKVVLITGGAMGQGRGHAYKYAQNGFNVVLSDLLEPGDDAFQETIKQCKAYGAEVLALKCDITASEDVEKLFACAWEKFGRIDVVIANAGIINFGYTWELTDQQVEKVIEINLIGTWRTDKYATKYMLKQGFGRIINISSTSGLYGTPKLATYCMSKWGIIGLTRTLAKEVGSKGIIVNALCPTKVKTPMCETMEYVEFINDLTGNNFKSVEEMYAGVPFLEVDDITSMVYWLGTSKEAGKFNGRDVALDLGTLQ